MATAVAQDPREVDGNRRRLKRLERAALAHAKRGTRRSLVALERAARNYCDNLPFFTQGRADMLAALFPSRKAG